MGNIPTPWFPVLPITHGPLNHIEGIQVNHIFLANHVET